MTPTTQAATAFPPGSYGFPPTPQQPAASPYSPSYPAQPPLAPSYPPQQYQSEQPYQPSPPAAYDETPTQAYVFDPVPAPAPPFDSSFHGAADLAGGQHVGLPELRDDSPRPNAPASAIDALFGDSQFREYEPGMISSEGLASLGALREREPREPMGTTQKVLLWVAGGLVAALAFVGLFILGTKLGALIPPAAPEVEASGPPVVVEAQPPPVGPLAPGTYDWDQLLGAECLEPFTSAWQEEYTVVDCASPHTAQMVFHGYFADEAFAPYPGEAELRSRINLLCTSPAALDYSIASQLSDMQVAASYAVAAADWDAGQRDYYCFVMRSTAEPLAASVAIAAVPSETLVPTVPGNDP